MRWGALFLFAFAQLVAANPIVRRWDDFSEKHSWLETPKGWELKSEAPSGHVFPMRIGLKQSGMDDLIANLMEISDPTHSRYAQHLTKEEAEVFITPHTQTVEAVEAWLNHHGIDTESAHRSPAGDWVTIHVSVEQAERMLNTKYNVYHHPVSGEEVVRALAYSLPSELHAHINVVSPTTYFGTTKSMRATSFVQPEIVVATEDKTMILRPGSDAAVPSSCAKTVTPSCLRTLYNTVDYVPVSTSVNKLGVAGYLKEYASTSDLTTFFTKFRTDVSGAPTFNVALINGGLNTQSSPGVEANLDIQYTTGISYPTPNIYYSTGGSPPFKADSATTSNTNEPYLDFLTFILAQSTIPQVITTSYGDDEQTVPNDYAISVCNMFAELGSRGTSVFFSSGDSGVGAGSCKNNDGTNKVVFQPSFPASCPFVTAVGGTVGVAPETAVSFSGGGFSRYFSQPSYQSTAVKTFLNSLGSTNSGLFNASGRAYPDLSAQASGFQVVVGGRTTSVGGTSASGPTVAGIFSLLNDFRISKGKPSLGFINPLIYSTAASGFNDITSGSNPGCGTNGFTARTGWDPVTGLGTPNFTALQALVLV